MKNTFLRDFFVCGVTGWCIECTFTGINSVIFKNDKELTCHTSIWMFPIYGMAALLSPVIKLLKRENTLIRGGIYTVLIYIGEYISGNILKKYKVCPWDYSEAKFNYKGVIRFDYAPFWFLAGLLYEKILKQN